MKLLITTQIIDIDDPVLGFFHRWVEEFAKHFDHVYVICLKKGRHTLPSNVTVFSLGKETGANRIKYFFRFYYYFTYIFFIKRVSFVFHHMGAIYNIVALPFFLLRKLFHTKFYWWKTHGKMQHLKERLALRFCDVVLTAGDKSFGFPTPKLRSIGHAIDTDFFTLPSATKETKRMLSVGRVRPIKKIEQAISVTAKLIEKGYDTTLGIIGPLESKTYHQQLCAQIPATAEQSIQFVGSHTQQELRNEYHAADVLLHPIYEGGLDKVVLEAMASGVVPLTSIPSFESILSSHELFIPANDIDGYVRALERIMGLDKGERQKLCAELRAIVVQNHSLATLPKRIFSVG